MNIFHSNKKGLIRGILASMVFLFTMVLLMMACSLIVFKYTDEFSSVYGADPDIVLAITSIKRPYGYLDKIMVLLTFSLIAGTAVTSYRLATARVYFVVIFFSSFVLGFIGYILSYSAYQIVTDPAWITISHLFPLSFIIVTRLHWIALVQIVIGSIALFGKKEKGQYLTTNE